tara:strand:+ start:328 stop:528 length:201 start_codon:yes stop_codon:yes gene_type:complete
MNRTYEQAYNNLSYHLKADIGFPDAYIFLTTEQERFIIEMFYNEREAVKEALLEAVDEMKGLIDEL